MSAIDFYGLTRLHDENFRQCALKRMEDILRSGNFVEGDDNKAFEKMFARLQNARHCLLVANGTDALEIALQVSGVGPGDLVGVPGITFHASAEAVLNVGAQVALIDVNPRTGLIDPSSLERVSQQHKLNALIPVHIYGLPAPMEEIASICSVKNIKIIEDAAQACGTFLAPGVPVGSPVGDGDNLATFSFYPTKNLGAMGDAGCILAHTDEQARQIRQWRNHGRGGKGFGRNSRCDHLQAAVLNLKLAALEDLNLRRKDIASSYHMQLADLSLTLVPQKFLPLSSWHLYPVWLASPQEALGLSDFLDGQGIECKNFYARALSGEPWLAECAGEWENAERLAGRAVCLPIHPLLSDEEVSRVVREVRHFLDRGQLQ